MWSVWWRRAAVLVALLGASVAAQATMVRISTSFGPIDVDLFDAAVPTTVNNFLSYVRDDSFRSTFVHRSVSLASGGIGIIQGGGFVWTDGANPPVRAVATRAPIVLEASNDRPNQRGTIAMARTNVANSATSQWFINTSDNSSSLGLSNGGGYAVFGRVTAASLAVADRIAALPTISATGCGSAYGALAALPYVNRPSVCADINSTRTLVMVLGARELATTSASASDRIFNYLEAAYPQYAAPASPPTLTWDGYTYRYYAGTNAYVGTRDGNVYYLVPALGPNITLLGTVAQWLELAAAQGY